MKSKIGNVLHKVCGTTPETELQPKEILSYSVAGFGQNLIYALIASFLMIFLTDSVGIKAYWLAWLFLGARLFDAFNDPIMGSIVDKTKSKWGKLRPYLLFTPIPISILTLLCFTRFSGLSHNGAFVYISIIYVLWGIVYTIVDVPYWGLSTSMTADTDKRNIMLTIARLLCTLGSGIVTVLLPPVLQIVKNNTATAYMKSNGINLTLNDFFQDSASTAKAYLDLQASSSSKVFFVAALIIGIIAIPMFLIGFKNSKERFYNDKEVNSLGKNLSLLFKNKPLMLIVLSGALGAARYLYMASGIYYAKYTMGKESLFSLITILVVPGGLIASVLTPYLSKKFSKKNVYIWSHIIGGIFMLLLYFVGLKTHGKGVATYAFGAVVIVIMGVPSGFANILSYAMIADTVDYLEDKLGERAEGICFAMQTFISKIGVAVTGFATLLGLGTVTYEPNVAATSETLKVLWILTALLPGLSTLLSAIPLFFYKFTEDEQAKAVARVAERKKEAAAS